MAIDTAERVRRYLRAIGPAVAGSGRSHATVLSACLAGHDFGLDLVGDRERRVQRRAPPCLRPDAGRRPCACVSTATWACEGFRPFWRTTARTRRTHFHTFSSPGFDPPTVTPLARRETTNHAHHPRPSPPHRQLRPHLSHRPYRLLIIEWRPRDQLDERRLAGCQQRDRLRVCPARRRYKRGALQRQHLGKSNIDIDDVGHNVRLPNHQLWGE